VPAGSFCLVTERSLMRDHIPCAPCADIALPTFRHWVLSRLPAARGAPAPGAARAAQGREQTRELTSIPWRKCAEGHFSRPPPCSREAVEQERTPFGERDEDRAPVVPVDRPCHKAGRLEPVHHRGGGPGHNLESSGDVRHPDRSTCPLEETDDACLSTGQPHRTKLCHRAPVQAPRGPHEKLGELGRVLGLGRDVGRGVGRRSLQAISEHTSM